jgi:hypothetical protein
MVGADSVLTKDTPVTRMQILTRPCRTYNLGRKDLSLHVKCISIIALAAAITAGTVGATPMTWNFSGTIYAEQVAGAWVSTSIGKTVSGTLTLDLSLLSDASTDGISYHNGAASFKYPFLTSLPLHGSATGGALNIAVGGGPYDYMSSYVNKGSANTWEGVTTYNDSYGIGADSCRSVALGPCNSIYLGTSMNTDGVHASGIFGNATYDHPDLSFDQRVNWLSSGANSFGVIANGSTYEYFNLTSVMQSPVPEPGSVVMYTLGLFALTLRVRRRTLP